VARPHDSFGLLGATIADKYRIDDVLGEGGYGVVYGGVHLLLDAPIAIKCMKSLGSTLALETRATRLFLNEARVLFELSHPGIVRMFDVGTIEHNEHRVPYVVLERLEGHSLEAELARRAAGHEFGRDEIVAIFLPVLEALAYAHAHGVAHRDLKPSNLMLMPRDDGTLRVKVLDFGVASWAGEQRQPSGFTGFTPAYAAPEQWDEELSLAGEPSDVFSLALILSEVCTLSRAFPFTSPARILRAILDPARRFDVERRRRDLPVGLDALLLRGTAVDPAERHPDAQALLDDFRAIFGIGEGDKAGRFEPAAVPPAPAPAQGEAPPGKPDTVTRPGDGFAVTSPPLAQTLGAPAAPAASAKAPWLVATIASLAAAGAAGAAWRLAARDPAAPAAPAASVAVVASAAEVAPRAPSASALPEATLAVRAIVAGSALEPAAVEKQVTAQLAGMRRCYEGALARVPGIAGRYLTVVAVYPAGHQSPTETPARDLDEADWVERAIVDVELRGCLRQEVSKLRFPPHERAPIVGVTLAFELQPRPGGGLPARETEPVVREESLDSSFDYSFEKNRPADPPSPATLSRVGDLVAIEYEGGAAGCVIFPRDESLTCRWLIHDDTGGATLRKTANGYAGPWGTWPSDSDGGVWRLTR
jgi:serine/threonine-protein kinase